jgi:predicted transposase YdaD
MSLPYDATLKALLSPIDDWLIRLGITVHGPIEELTVDLSTVTAAADKVYRVLEAAPWLLHVEVQASRDPLLSRRLLKYNALLYDLCGVPVHSVVILLRREADDPSLTGELQYRARPALGGLQFQYRVARVWEWSVEELLTGGLATLPLAPLSAEVSALDLPQIIRRIDERLRRETIAAEVSKLWTATYVLMGLRFSQELSTAVMQGVLSMKESVTYQAILREGEARGEARGEATGEARGEARGALREARNSLLSVGRGLLGDPTKEQENLVNGIADLDLLRRRIANLPLVKTWEELLQRP